jgi:glycosyltransferase involved in cell wall biosynthesis
VWSAARKSSIIFLATTAQTDANGLVCRALSIRRRSASPVKECIKETVTLVKRIGQRSHMISILIPSKNEKRILEVLVEIENYFPTAQTIVCNDRYGYGKGWAVREALQQAQHDVICFLDGDMDIHPRMIWRLLPFLTDYDIVLGRKQISKMFLRGILTRLSRWYILAMFGLNVDTQTGIKLFRKEAILPWKSNSFAFDIEILSNARRIGLNMVEVPVDANVNRNMSLKAIWKCFAESIRLKSKCLLSD